MENLEFYFLRTFEKDVAKEILFYAARLDESDQTLEDVPHLLRYVEHYGIRKSDIGVYGMVDNQLAGAAWVRMLNGSQKGSGYIDDNTPELVFGVKPQFRNQGVGTKILEQLMHEVSLSYPQMSLAVREDNPVIKLYERLGFEKVEGSDTFDEIRQIKGFKMLKILPEPPKANDDAQWFEQTQKWRMPQN